MDIRRRSLSEMGCFFVHDFCIHCHSLNPLLSNNMFTNHLSFICLVEVVLGRRNARTLCGWLFKGFEDIDMLKKVLASFFSRSLNSWSTIRIVFKPLYPNFPVYKVNGVRLPNTLSSSFSNANFIKVGVVPNKKQMANPRREVFLFGNARKRILISGSFIR